MLGPFLFSVFINGLEEVEEGKFTKFADETKLEERDNSPAGSDAIPGDLEMSKERVRENLMKFIKQNHQVLSLCRKHRPRT
ncbi:hypothetical protein BTVI_42804 [Pitangus sulphuratus]|nr:hypothetical protein BTVI_42804 [Pitangus sulphuratus]